MGKKFLLRLDETCLVLHALAISGSTAPAAGTHDDPQGTRVAFHNLSVILLYLQTHEVCTGPRSKEVACRPYWFQPDRGTSCVAAGLD